MPAKKTPKKPTERKLPPYLRDTIRHACNEGVVVAKKFFENNPNAIELMLGELQAKSDTQVAYYYNQGD